MESVKYFLYGFIHLHKIFYTLNTYSEDPKYIFNLLLSVITLSIKTLDLIDKLPELD